MSRAAPRRTLLEGEVACHVCKTCGRLVATMWKPLPQGGFVEQEVYAESWAARPRLIYMPGCYRKHSRGSPGRSVETDPDGEDQGPTP